MDENDIIFDVHHQQQPQEHEFSKFATFINEYIKPNMTAPYFKRHHGQLMFDDDKIHVAGYDVNDSFKTHYWEIIQMTKMSKNTPNFPFQIYVNFTVDEKYTSHILSFELWIDSFLFSSHLCKEGTFPFEIYFTNLLRTMTSKCKIGIEIPTSHIDSGMKEDVVMTDRSQSIPHWNSTYPLLRHELQSLAWMYDLEKTILTGQAAIHFNTSSVPILNTGYYYNQANNNLIIK